MVFLMQAGRDFLLNLLFSDCADCASTERQLQGQTQQFSNSRFGFPERAGIPAGAPLGSKTKEDPRGPGRSLSPDREAPASQRD
jgi:hypothetical protein